MTYTAIATPVPNTLIQVSTFGALVTQDLADHEGRISSNEARLTTLETPYRADCAFYISGAAGGTLKSTPAAAAQLIDVWTPLPPAVSYPGLISHSAGVFTINKTGFWAFSLHLRFSVTTDCYAMIGSSSTTLWAKNSSNGSRNVSTDLPPRFYTSGTTLRTYAYTGVAGAITREATNDNIPAFYASYCGS
jgi:hypothetical protein